MALKRTRSQLDLADLAGAGQQTWMARAFSMPDMQRPNREGLCGLPCLRHNAKELRNAWDATQDDHSLITEMLGAELVYWLLRTSVARILVWDLVRGTAHLRGMGVHERSVCEMWGLRDCERCVRKALQCFKTQHSAVSVALEAEVASVRKACKNQAKALLLAEEAELAAAELRFAMLRFTMRRLVHQRLAAIKKHLWRPSGQLVQGRKYAIEGKSV